MTDAGKRAAAKVGRSNKLGMCLAECINPAYGSPYSIPGPWRWGGNGRAWAINFWLAAVAHGTVVKTADPAKIPKGALAFMVKNADKGKAKPGGAGHVFIGAGGGYAYSTDRPKNYKWGRVTIRSIESAWGMTLVGYILVTADGYDLRDETSTKPPVAKWSDPDTFVLGATGADVKRLGERLNVWAIVYGYTPIAKPGSPFTIVDQKAVKAFQMAQGWAGENADGFPGKETLKRLAADPKPVLTPGTPIVWDERVHGINAWADYGASTYPSRVDDLNRVRDTTRARKVLVCEQGGYEDGELLDKAYGWGGRRAGTVAKDKASFVVHSGKDVRIAGGVHWDPAKSLLISEDWYSTLPSSTHNGLTAAVLQDRETGGLSVNGVIHCVPWPIGPNDVKKWNDQRYEEVGAALEIMDEIRAEVAREFNVKIVPGILGEDFNGPRTDSKYPGGDGPGRAAKDNGWVDAWQIAAKRLGITTAQIDRFLVSLEGVEVVEHNVVKTNGATDHPYAVGVLLRLTNG
jgi:hypothetical protein